MSLVVLRGTLAGRLTRHGWGRMEINVAMVRLVGMFVDDVIYRDEAGFVLYRSSLLSAYFQLATVDPECRSVRFYTLNEQGVLDALAVNGWAVFEDPPAPGGS